MPREHIWIECENDQGRIQDSITSYGPISRKLAVGEVKHVIWPPSSFRNLDTIEEAVRVEDKTRELQGRGQPRVRHSDTMSNDEIYRKYGRPKYSDNEPDNSEIPGWTMGYGEYWPRMISENSLKIIETFSTKMIDNKEEYVKNIEEWI